MTKFKPSSERSQHLVFKDRKRLITRLLFAKNFDGEVSGNSDDANLLAQMRKQVLGETDLPDLYDKPSIQLDKILRIAIRSIRKLCPQNPKRNTYTLGHQDDIHRKIALFTGDIRLVRCSRCKQRYSHLCNGTFDEDNRVVKNGGECWQFFYEIFIFALKTSEDSYQKYINKFPELPPLEVAFKTVPNTTSSIKASISASTTFDDVENAKIPNKRRSITTIALPVEEFTAKNYFGLMYAFFHELIVHVPQALLSSEKRDIYGEDCAFAEGLVDAVAHRLLQKVFENQSSELPPSINRHIETFVQQADFEHSNRRHYISAPYGEKSVNDLETRAVHIRALGWKLFVRLNKLRQKEDWLFSLILGLNVESLNKTERGVLIAMLYGIVQIGPESCFGLLNLLDKYVERGDIGALREEIQKEIQKWSV